MLVLTGIRHKLALNFKTKTYILKLTLTFEFIIYIYYQMLPNYKELFNINNYWWADHFYYKENRHLYMNQQQWRNLVQNITTRSGSDPLRARFYIARLQKERNEFINSPKYTHQPKPYENLYNLYMDMITEPCKYSEEDLAKLEEYDAILMNTSWKDEINKYWSQRYNDEVVIPEQQEQERLRKEAEDQEALRIWAYFDGYATKIQALVRGHHERCRNVNRWTECCNCLAHRVSKHQVGWRYWMCSDCFNEQHHD